MGFREPDRRSEMIDVCVRQQDGAQVVDAEPELSQRREHIVAVAGESGVDQHDTVLVCDDRPVDQVGVSEMHDVGDGR